MTRRNFYEILTTQKIDINLEYTRLYEFFYSDKAENMNLSFYDIINNSFYKLWLCGTSKTLDDFDKEYGYNFERCPQKFDLNYLILFCEYLTNILLAFKQNTELSYCVNSNYILNHIAKLIEKLSYKSVYRDDYIIFIPKSPAAISVAEIVDIDMSYKILEYNHHSLKGDLSAKKEILNKIAGELEPQRKTLNNIDPQLEKNLFLSFNRFNIRHNNCDPKDTSNYVEEFDLLNDEEKEELYDFTYDQSLIAFLKLENKERKEIFNNIKKKMDNKQ